MREEDRSHHGPYRLCFLHIPSVQFELQRQPIDIPRHLSQSDYIHIRFYLFLNNQTLYRAMPTYKDFEAHVTDENWNPLEEFKVEKFEEQKLMTCYIPSVTKQVHIF